MNHRRQHEGKSLASCGTGDEHEGESSASYVTGGEHAAASVSRQHARGEGIGDASFVDANGGDRKLVWQDGK
jgi:hypothetical protein